MPVNLPNLGLLMKCAAIDRLLLSKVQIQLRPSADVCTTGMPKHVLAIVSVLSISNHSYKSLTD